MSCEAVMFPWWPSGAYSSKPSETVLSVARDTGHHLTSHPTDEIMYIYIYIYIYISAQDT